MCVFLNIGGEVVKFFDNCTYFGIALSGIWLFSIRLNLLPEILEELCVVFSLIFLAIGIFFTRYNVSKLKEPEKTLFIK